MINRHFGIAHRELASAYSIPSSVRAIPLTAFFGCTGLVNVELKEGLESIGCRAFAAFGFRFPAFTVCTLLQHISIPSTVKEIGRCAFLSCTQLVNVELREGLERIHEWAFRECSSLERIIIPSTVNNIHKDAFRDCSGLVSIEFCEEMEQFITDLSLRRWWNSRISKLPLRRASGSF